LTKLTRRLPFPLAGLAPPFEYPLPEYKDNAMNTVMRSGGKNNNKVKKMKLKNFNGFMQ